MIEHRTGRIGQGWHGQGSGDLQGRAALFFSSHGRAQPRRHRLIHTT
jgi:hypothetical protein